MRRLGRVAIVAVLASWAFPVRSAGAHTVTGVSPTNYASEVLEIRPPLPGVSVRVLDLGRRLELTNRTSRPVIVIGASGKPYRTIAPRSVVRWREARTRIEGPPPQRVTEHPNRRAVVSSWVIELQSAHRNAAVVGRITYVPPPEPLLWVGLTLIVLAATIAVAWTRDWGRWLSVALAALIASDVVQSLGSAAASRTSIAQQFGQVVVGGLVTTAAWIVGAVALRSLQRNHEGGLLAAAGVGIVVAAFSGATDFAAFNHSQVASIFPAVITRIAVALAVGLGVGLAGAAIAVIARDPALRPKVSSPDL